MSEKKHIDRVFQEKLKDFEAAPDDAVWQNIKSKLEKEKDDDKVIPIWWRLAGVAALLLLLLTIGGLVFNNGVNSNPEIQVVDTETNNSTDNIDNNNNPTDAKESLKLNSNNPNESLASENNSTQTNQESSDGSTYNNKTNNGTNGLNVTNNKRVVASTNSTNKTVTNSDAVTNNDIESKNNIASDLKEDSVIKQNENQNTSVANVSEKPKDAISNIKIDVEDSNNINTDIKIGEDSIAITQNNIPEENNKLENTSISDSLTIEEEIAKIEDIKNIIEEEKQLNRWSISPNVAPVYFNSLGKGSSIDEQFNNNSKTGEVNMSYGVSGSYAINDKLVVRAGINKVNLGYNTNDVLVLETTGKGPSSALLSNVSENNNDTDFSMVSARSVLLDQNSNLATNFNVGSINQTLGFVEVPVELQYNLINTKLGLNLIGGFSSFFLSENRLHSQINGNSTLIGEANNVNDVSYSANFGLGLNYNFSERFNFNLEPIFKYQINTFNNVSGSFNPYFIGFYTGFSFKF